MKRSGKALSWSIKNYGEVLNKLKFRGFRVASLSTYDFSTLYITSAKHGVKIEQIKYLVKYMPICLILSCAKEGT